MNDAMTPEEEAFLNPELASKPESRGAKSKTKEPTTRKSVQKEPVQAIIHRTNEPPHQDFGGKSKLTIDINADIGSALLRASLERKLAKQSPHTQRDIVSEAIATWLKSHGYLKK